MTTSSKTLCSWSSFFNAPVTATSFFPALREAIASSFNDSSRVHRQSLRELALALLFEGRTQQYVDLLFLIKKKSYYLDDARSLLLYTLCCELLGEIAPDIQSIELPQQPTLEGLESAFLFSVLGVLKKVPEFTEKGERYIKGVQVALNTYPASLGVDVSEFESITPEGLISAYTFRDPASYPGTVENSTLYKKLSSFLNNNKSDVSPLPLHCRTKNVTPGELIVPCGGKEDGILSCVVSDTLSISTVHPSFFPLFESALMNDELLNEASNCRSFSKVQNNGGRDIGWVHWTSKSESHHELLTFRTVAPDEVFPFALCFFVQCESLSIDGWGELSKGSLTKYQSGVSELECSAKGTSFRLTPLYEGEMHVLPLAGGKHFYGADFLVAYVVENDKHVLKLAIS